MNWVFALFLGFSLGIIVGFFFGLRIIYWMAVAQKKPPGSDNHE